MIKFKMFMGMGLVNAAAEYANTWLDCNPNIKILQVDYTHDRLGDPAICIMYEEIDNAQP